MNKEDSEICLSMTFDVKLKADADDRKPLLNAAIRNAIKRYRNATRQATAILFAAHAAGAEVEMKDGEARIKGGDPSPILKHFGKPMKGSFYEMRSWIAERLHGLSGDFPDFAMMAVKTWWFGKDAEFPKASKGWLALQFSRRPPVFMHLALPFKGPRYNGCRLDDHSVFLKIDQTNGSNAADTGKLKEIEFKLTGKDGKCEAERYYIWKNLVSGLWRAGTCFLAEGDKGWRFRVTYYRPKNRAVQADNGRQLEVAFTTQPESFISLSLGSGHKPSRGKPVDDLLKYDVSIISAWHQLLRLQKQQERIKGDRRSCGNKNGADGSGFPAAFKAESVRGERLTKARTNMAKGWNHHWTSKIVERARIWNCSEIVVHDMPQPVDPKVPDVTKGLLGHPWQWANFKFDLEYKCKDEGVKLLWAKK